MKSIPDPRLGLLHRRYLAQAGWTRSIRQRLLAMTDFEAGDWLLEVGSGTGVITAELCKGHACHVLGVDIDFPTTCFARQYDPFSSYAVADGIQLPFEGGAFDAVLCHFLLLWTKDPERILGEMLRATRPGGWIIAFAEPDYGGRIDYPDALKATGLMQTQALEIAGADPFLGRRLRALFQGAGALDVLTGVLGAEWRPDDLPQILESEWDVLQRDLQGQLSADELLTQHGLNQTAVQAGTRTLFVPTFFGMGRSSS